MPTLSIDLRLAWRRVRAQPLLPLLAFAVLTLGIGSSTAVLGVADAVLIQPLPYPHEDALVVVTSGFPRMNLRQMGLSGPEATELGRLVSGFESVGFGYEDQVAATVEDASVPASVGFVSAGFLRALAPTPLRGRLVEDDDDRAGAPLRVMLGEGFWRRQLGARPDIVGKTIIADGRNYEVVGVLPSRADFVGRPIDLWIPLKYDATSPTSNRANHVFTVIGRRRAGLSPSGLQADVDAAVRRWGQVTHQMHVPDASFHPLALTPLTDTIRGPVRRATLVLIAAVCLVLIIAAANAATLLVARADARATEMAVRSALGASRGQLLRLHAIDAGLLSVAALMAGIALARIAGRALLALAPPGLSGLDLSLPFWRTTAIAAFVASGVACACTVAPFLRLRLAMLPAALSADNRSGTASEQRHLGRRALVTIEIALALALFSGAALMIESVWHLTRVDLGFNPAGVTHASITLPTARYTDRTAIDTFYAGVIDRLKARPDVIAVGVTSGLVPERRPNNSSFLFEGSTADPHTGLPPMQFLQFVSPGAFAALGLTLKEGRAFTDADVRLGQPVAILNARAAAMYFPGGAIGRRLRAFSPGLPWMTVIGVVADARQNGLAREAGTEVFIPVVQADNAFGAVMTRDLQLFVRGTGVNAAALRDLVRASDPAAAISAVRPLDAVIDASMAGTTFLMSVLTAFAAIALLLSASGVYGVVMHAVGARTREIGVRRALGAGSITIVQLVSRQAASLVGAGVAAGAFAAWAAGRALEPFVFGVSPSDPRRLLAIALTLVVIATAACLVPLLRALRIDPAVALRQ